MKRDEKLMAIVVEELAGREGVVVARALREKRNFSEFKLAERVNKDVHATRNILYKLYAAGLASFVRKKDKKKGWYIYYWTFNAKNTGHMFSAIMRQKLERLMERLEREKSKSFYACENACFRLEFDQAFGFEFRCPECGALMNAEDNREKIAELEREKEKIEEKMKTV